MNSTVPRLNGLRHVFTSAIFAISPVILTALPTWGSTCLPFMQKATNVAPSSKAAEPDPFPRIKNISFELSAVSKFEALAYHLQTARIRNSSSTALQTDLSETLSLLKKMEADLTTDQYLSLLKFVASLSPSLFEKEFVFSPKVADYFSAKQQYSLAELTLRQTGRLPNLRMISRLLRSDLVQLFELAAIINPPYVVQNLSSWINLLDGRLAWEDTGSILSEAARSGPGTIPAMTSLFKNLGPDELYDIATEVMKHDPNLIFGAEPVFRLRAFSASQLLRLLILKALRDPSETYTLAQELRQQKLISPEELRALRNFTAEMKVVRNNAVEPDGPTFVAKSYSLLPLLSRSLFAGIESADDPVAILDAASKIAFVSHEDLEFLRSLTALPYEITTLQALVISALKEKLLGNDLSKYLIHEQVDSKKIDQDAFFSAITGLNFHLIRRKQKGQYVDILERALSLQDYSFEPIFAKIEVPKESYGRFREIISLVHRIECISTARLQERLRGLKDPSEQERQDAHARTLQEILDSFSPGLIAKGFSWPSVCF